jgi:hypothetical protein
MAALMGPKNVCKRKRKSTHIAELYVNKAK